MPVVIDPYGRSVSTVQLRSVDYSYEYPNGLDFKPGSELHERIKSLILQRARESKDVMRKRYSSWRKIDRSLTSYIPADNAEKLEKLEDDRKPINVVIPVSYAILETLLTYYVSVYFDTPVFGYEGSGPEDTVGAMLLELIVQQQVRRKKMLLDLYIMWRDALVYGFGVASPMWVTEVGTRTVRSKPGLIGDMLGLFKDLGIMRSKEKVTTYEGNKLEVIDPYMILFDPNSSIHKIQDSEFVGWIDRTNRIKLLRDESSGYVEMFNARYLEHISGKSVLYEQDGGRTERFGVENEFVSSSTKPVDVIYMYMSLVPNEWGLGKENRPEKWLFMLAGDEIILRAQPIDLDHDQFPIAICAPDYDGHSVAPIGRLEIEYGAQEAIDFMIRSFMAEQRKSINNTFVVDPEIIDIHDFARAKNGGIVRVRRRFWGEGRVADAIHQVGVNNVTQQNIPNVQYFRELMNDTSGATDAVRGIYRKTSERVSATESANVFSGALSRIEKAARLAGIQAHYDIAYQLGCNIRQFMTEETYVKIIGRYESDLKREFGISDFAKVSPLNMNLNFDVIVHDGSLPYGGNVQGLLQLLQIAASDQELREVLDYVRIVKTIARQAGVKNVEDFVKKQPQVVPTVVGDEQVQKQLEAGNIVPLSEGI
jgi:hypothetical protein